MRKFAIFFLILTSLFSKELLIFAGSASKPPLDEAAKLFEKKKKVKVNIVYGGSGFVLSQMKLTKRGDLYFPGSSDYMQKAIRDGVVYKDSKKIIVYLVPSINVQKGNPKNIKSLKDLTKPGIRVAIANPNGVCVGAYAIEIIEKNFSQKEKEAFRKNLVNYTGSCSKTASAISLKQADAVIGWRVFHYWDPNRIQNVPLKPNQIVRVGYIPIAISKFTKDKKLAKEFIDFLTSKEGKAVFAKYSYFATPKEAFSWIGEQKRVGGEYIVPKEWIK